MFSAVLLTISVVALGQFALYYWRAVLTGVASQPISSRVLEAAHLQEASLCPDDFEKLASLRDLIPELKAGRRGLGFVRTYYEVVRKASEWLGQVSPAFMSWSERECVMCTRYAAVQIQRSLEMNLAQAATIRSC